MSDKKFISIVTPCYNEVDNIRYYVAVAKTTLKQYVSRQIAPKYTLADSIVLSCF